MASFNKYTFAFYKEVFLSLLAVLSLLLLLFEFVTSPPQSTVQLISRFDFLVACIFLIDFFIALLRAKNKKDYFRKNWFLLLASIPLVDSWAEVLRGLRILALVRLIRAGEHLVYATRKTKN